MADAPATILVGYDGPSPERPEGCLFLLLCLHLQKQCNEAFARGTGQKAVTDRTRPGQSRPNPRRQRRAGHNASKDERRCSARTPHTEVGRAVAHGVGPETYVRVYADLPARFGP